MLLTHIQARWLAVSEAEGITVAVMLSTALSASAATEQESVVKICLDTAQTHLSVQLKLGIN